MSHLKGIVAHRKQRNHHTAMHLQRERKTCEKTQFEFLDWIMSVVSPKLKEPRVPYPKKP